MALLKIIIICRPEREDPKGLTLAIEWNHSQDDIMRVTVNTVFRIHRLASVGFVFMFWKKDEIYQQIEKWSRNKDELIEFAKFSKVKRVEDVTKEICEKFYKERIDIISSMYFKLEYIKALNKFFKEYGVPIIMRLEEVVEFKPRSAIIESMKTVSPNDPTPKTRRNKRIVKLIDSGWSYSEVCSEYNFRSKATVHKIYHREKSRMQ